MNRAEMMLQESDTHESFFTDFILKKAKPENCDKLFCFYEGDTDKDYYNFRIEQYCKKNIEYFICGGKSKVKNSKDMILKNSKHRKDSILFFIDRDFDNDFTDEYLYVTSHYSIENFYITDDAINKILRKIIFRSNLSNEEELSEFNGILDLLKERKREFVEKTLLLNAFFSLQRKKTKPTHQKPKLDKIKTIKSAPFVTSIKVNEVIVEYNFDTLKNHTDNYIEIETNELECEIDRLQVDSERLLRGKYFNSFIVSILKDIIEESNKTNGGQIFKKRRKVSFHICENTFISDYTNCATTPDCLYTFLDKFRN